METEASAVKAMKMLQGLVIDEHSLKLELSIKKEPLGETKRRE
jgi:hypothetical protein